MYNVYNKIIIGNPALPLKFKMVASQQSWKAKFLYWQFQVQIITFKDTVLFLTSSSGLPGWGEMQGPTGSPAPAKITTPVPAKIRDLAGVFITAILP